MEGKVTSITKEFEDDIYGQLICFPVLWIQDKASFGFNEMLRKKITMNKYEVHYHYGAYGVLNYLLCPQK